MEGGGRLLVVQELHVAEAQDLEADVEDGVGHVADQEQEGEKHDGDGHVMLDLRRGAAGG